MLCWQTLQHHGFSMLTLTRLVVKLFKSSETQSRILPKELSHLTLRRSTGSTVSPNQPTCGRKLETLVCTVCLLQMSAVHSTNIYLIKTSKASTSLFLCRADCPFRLRWPGCWIPASLCCHGGVPCFCIWLSKNGRECTGLTCAA